MVNEANSVWGFVKDPKEGEQMSFEISAALRNIERNIVGGCRGHSR